MIRAPCTSSQKKTTTMAVTALVDTFFESVTFYPIPIMQSNTCV